MRIERDVYGIARFFGVDPSLLQAVVNAEGDIVGAVQRLLPCLTMRDTALRVAARSAVRAMCSWIKDGGEERKDAFIGFWASRCAPISAKNDPQNFNANWASNVDRLWTPVNA